MNILIKSMHLENFKGIKDATYTFDNTTVWVGGRNGIGKTTIITAYLWTFADKDSELNSNPNVFPIGAEEVTPTVTINLDIDGKPVEFAKIQKRTVSKPNAAGLSKVSTTNSYMINSVPKSERDMKEYFSDLGVDFDKFLPLSHAEVFTSQKSAEMRKVLFDMVSKITDLEVSKQNKELADLSKLLENYSLDEIIAMQKSTLRKIAENYGKEGEILRAKIEGLENAKLDIDVAEQELLKNELERKISENENAINRLKSAADNSDIKSKILDLKFEENDLYRQKNDELISARRTIERLIEDKKCKYSELKFNKSSLEVDNKHLNVEKQNYSNAVDVIKEDYKNLKAKTFDKKNAICPTCGREYDPEKQNELMEGFKIKQKEDLSVFAKRGKDLAALRDKVVEQITKNEALIEALDSDINQVSTDIKNATEELANIPKVPDMTTCPRYGEVLAEIERLNKAMEIKPDLEIATLEVETNTLKAQLSECLKKIATFENNVRIDGQIEQLRKAQVEYEQNKADAENILNQVKEFNKTLNELVTDEINSYFEFVKFKLYEYQKNGEVKDCCIPTYNGKELGSSMNRALELHCKLDIISGLQNFNNQHYPVLIDNFECIDSEKQKGISMPCQLITFSVTDENEITIR